MVCSPPILPILNFPFRSCFWVSASTPYTSPIFPTISLYENESTLNVFKIVFCIFFPVYISKFRHSSALEQSRLILVSLPRSLSKDAGRFWRQEFYACAHSIVFSKTNRLLKDLFPGQGLINEINIFFVNCYINDGDQPFGIASATASLASVIMFAAFKV